MRARKPKNTDWKLSMYAEALVKDPCAHRGAWLDDFAPSARELHVDLGCGKGAFSVDSAFACPYALFIGIDVEPICISNAMEKAVAAGASNAYFVLEQVGRLDEMFAEGEIDAIHLNFSTPLPKRKHAERRLTYLDNLMLYRRVLAPDGRIFMRTDNEYFFDFSLTQFDLAGYELVWLTRDLHAEGLVEVQTEYEKALSEKGARICALEARMGECPADPVQTAELSLAEYLPDDLDTIGHLPYGMEDTIINIRNRRAREQRKARAVARR